ncbi:MAG: DNA cytosine methyltransferase, partial [Treponema sp.]|nr:DNA cytosine methyltransferase [Treponema sp.]
EQKNGIRNRKMVLGTENTIFDYGKEKDIERLNNASDGNHSAKLNKMPEGHLGSYNDAEICDIDHPLASTVTARYYKGIGAHKDNLVLNKVVCNSEETIRIKQPTKDGFIEMKMGGVCDLTYPSSSTRRGRVQDGGETCPTITANGELHRIESIYRIRKLTPKECWRLMGFSDEDFAKAEAVNSNTQLYKQAGNSIVKDVLCAIFKQLNIHQA